MSYSTVTIGDIVQIVTIKDDSIDYFKAGDLLEVLNIYNNGEEIVAGDSMWVLYSMRADFMVLNQPLFRLIKYGA